jgi:parallel beta helix pectate lyase-like protein
VERNDGHDRSRIASRNDMDNRLALATLSLFCLSVHAETFVVTRFDDPLPDGCQPADCSLREAADAASQNDAFGGDDHIQLGAGTYTLIRGELAWGSTDQTLEIVGAGSTATHVSSTAALFSTIRDRTLRVRGLEFATTAGSAFSTNARMKDSYLLLDDVSIPLGGGGVGASGMDGFDATLDIRNSTIHDGISCDTGDGACLISGSRFSSLYVNPSVGPGPTVAISGSTLDGALGPDNSLSGFVIHASPGITITASTITHTRVGMHSAAAVPLTIRLDGLAYVDNAAPVRFGDDADVAIVDSVFQDNPTRALYAEGDSVWSISGSSFVDNVVDGSAGGAIVVEDAATVAIDNSTFAGNTFSVDAAAGGARGAAIGFRNGAGLRVDLRHVTIARPFIMPVGIEGTAVGGYGGTGDVIVNVDNSIVSGSCRFDAGALHHGAGNVESPASTCGFGSGNQVGVDDDALALGTLGDHGGSTPTMLPGAASVAIDAGSADRCTAFDQRGFVRPAGRPCDVGAIELEGVDVLFADGFE